MFTGSSSNSNGGTISLVDGQSGNTEWFLTSGFPGTGNFSISTTTAARFAMTTAGVVTMSGYGAGSASFTSAGVLTTSSDIRQKTNVESFSRAFESLRDIEPIVYNWSEDSGLNDPANTKYVGFSAQNIEGSIPEAVGKGANGYLSISDRPIIAALLNTVKSQQSQIESLMARIGRLEATPLLDEQQTAGASRSDKEQRPM
jgi:hypothetical protein